MEKKRLLLIGNTVPDDWEFRRGVETGTGKSWEMKACVINRFDGFHKISRYFVWFFSPLRLFFVRNRYEAVLSWEQFLGLILVFYCRLFHVRHFPRITIMGFIFKPKKGLIGRVFSWFVKYTASSRYVSRLVVYSQSEVDYYSNLFGVSPELFHVETLGIEDQASRIRPEAATELYSVSAGRSNRDYAFLRLAWPKDRECMNIVCDVEKSLDADNLRYLKNCHGDEYLRLLAGARLSVVPLVSEKFSSGQLVFLQSAMFGIPVIVTKNNTVHEYVENGKTGLVIDKTPEALEEALRCLDNRETYSAMSKNARKAFEEKFSLFEMGKRVGNKLSI